MALSKGVRNDYYASDVKQLKQAQEKAVEICKSIALEDIPDLLEKLCGMYGRIIDKWMARRKLRESEVLLSLKMTKELTALYTMYRTLRADVIKDITARSYQSPVQVSNEMKSIIN